MKYRTQEQLDARAKDLKEFGPEYAGYVTRPTFNGGKEYRAGGTRAFSRVVAEQSLKAMLNLGPQDTFRIEEVLETSFCLKPVKQELANS